jgi:hypothetical protein
VSAKTSSPGRDAGDGGSDLLDDTGQLVGRDGGQAVDRPLELVAGERCRVHPDERLTATGSRSVELLDREPLRAARLTEPDGTHHARARSHGRAIPMLADGSSSIRAPIIAQVAIAPMTFDDRLAAETISSQARARP